MDKGRRTCNSQEIAAWAAMELEEDSYRFLPSVFNYPLSRLTSQYLRPRSNPMPGRTKNFLALDSNENQGIIRLRTLDWTMKGVESTRADKGKSEILAGTISTTAGAEP